MTIKTKLAWMVAGLVALLVAFMALAIASVGILYALDFRNVDPIVNVISFVSTVVVGLYVFGCAVYLVVSAARQR